ncbi:MAG: VWA domain-containing protein [Opitutaceae bacterium]
MMAFPLPFAAATGFRLASPLWLLALLAIPAAAWLRRRRSVSVVLIPYASSWYRSSALAVSRWPILLAGAGVALVTLGLARPQRTEARPETRRQGYDIMLCIDLSGSMLSEDYERNGHRINRIDAIRPVIQSFIDRRPNDRIGIVLFSGHAYTLSPLTTDHAWLSQQLQRVRVGIIEDGTAIGDGLGVALSRLQEAGRIRGRSKGAFIVLLTDGANNMGTLAPMQAAGIARARGIPIYTIGAGKDGIVPIPVLDDNGNPLIEDGRKVYAHEQSDLDEQALRDIASETGGHFFRAADVGTVESAFRDIDASQKIHFRGSATLRTFELFPWLLVPGLGLLAIGAWRARSRS